uniref:Iodothyronine deiodinase n=1 Tax=Electrophorus electricus TaxID=8005 RepID=A0A4W4EDS9_ELEEL
MSVCMTLRHAIFVTKKVMCFCLLMDQEDSIDDPPLCVSDSNRMFSWESLKAVWHGHKLDFLKSAHLGYEAPNSEVVQLEDSKRSRILEYAKGKRPLILNFGSCT